MKTVIFLMLTLLLISGCKNQYPVVVTDQVMRRQIFKECMAALPAGPSSTKYNDWDEVVKSCDVVAAAQSRMCTANCEHLSL